MIRLGVALGIAAAIPVQQAPPPPKSAPAQTGADPHRYTLRFDPAQVAPLPLLATGQGPLLVIEAELNGRRLPALLDTGFTHSAIDAAAARELGLGAVAGAGPSAKAIDDKPVAGGFAAIDSLRVGPFTRTGGSLMVWDMAGVRAATDQPFVLVIGADLLSRMTILVNRAQGAMLLRPTGAPRPNTGSAASLRLIEPQGLFVTEGELFGKPLRVQIDTGADSELRVREGVWADIAPAGTRTTTMFSSGLGGTYVDRIARVDRFRIGSRTLDDTLVQIAAGWPDPEVDALIGMGLLAKYNLFIDVGAGVFMTDPAGPARPRRETLAGILGQIADDGLLVRHVMAGSPAEQAGIREGDRFCTIDGEPVRAAWIGTPANDWMTGPEGKTVTLGRCGGGEVRLTLRRFY